jgi:hypothetical protein
MILYAVAVLLICLGAFGVGLPKVRLELLGFAAAVLAFALPVFNS